MPAMKLSLQNVLNSVAGRLSTPDGDFDVDSVISELRKIGFDVSLIEADGVFGLKVDGELFPLTLTRSTPTSMFRLGRPVKRHKYGARRIEIDGIMFDSIKESRRYIELKQLEQAGEISNLELQPEYELQPAFDCCGKRQRRIVYRADFRYKDGDKVVVEDVKGYDTPVSRLKRKMVLYQYGIDVKLV